MNRPNTLAQTPWKYSFSSVDGRNANAILMYSLLLNGEQVKSAWDLTAL
jgi:hypothetical protein